MNETNRALERPALERPAPENQQAARRIYIAFCVASTLFMALIVLVATIVIMG
jgi:hypothetical protein